MDVISDWSQFAKNPLVGPALKRAPKINADYLAQDTGVYSLEIIVRNRH